MVSETRAWLEQQLDRPATESPSPVGRWLKGVLREVKDDRVTFEFQVRKEMTNPFGVLHGGMLAAMADDVIGTAVYALTDAEEFVSVNLSVDFLASVRDGETVMATARLVRVGNRTVHAECELRDGAGDRVARATSNLLKQSS